jgi:predicted XRE-type DNA-binding protein
MPRAKVSAVAKTSARHTTVPEIKVEIDHGSGNAFADLNVIEPTDMLIKSGLAMRLAELIKQRGLTQTKVAEMTGLNQADVSDIIRGKLQGYSTDRILRTLGELSANVEINVYAANGEKVGETMYVAAVA